MRTGLGFVLIGFLGVAAWPLDAVRYLIVCACVIGLLFLQEKS